MSQRDRAFERYPIPPVPDPESRELAEDLAAIRDNVGDEHYAKATARLFARGGKYHPSKRRARYALT